MSAQLASTQWHYVTALSSATVRVSFGYHPARQASRLNPIEALRYEKSRTLKDAT
jgi:ABC-type lipoprotein release transport system permease subunit